MPATCFKKAAQVSKQTEKVEECSSNTYLEHPTGEQAHWEQVGAMIGYKSSFPEMLSHSQTRMGRGSPLCEQMREQIVPQLKTNISQPAIARNLGISSSTVVISSKGSPQAVQHQKPASLCKGYHHMGSGTLQKTTVSYYSSSLHL